MGQTLAKIAQDLKDANKKVQLIYAFNGIGKTRLSREFKELVDTKAEREAIIENGEERPPIKFLYYNAYTEDLFYWHNDLVEDKNRNMIIRPNGFTELALGFLKEEGQYGNITDNFQRYTSKSITPKISDDFSEVRFSMLSGGDNSIENIKISKGEESNFIWCVFYSLIEHIVKIKEEAAEAPAKAAKAVAEAAKATKEAIEAAKEAKAVSEADEADEEAKVVSEAASEAAAKAVEAEARAEAAVADPIDHESELKKHKLNDLEYVFIDDPVSSLDDSHLIELAVNIAELVKKSPSTWKYVITTHNPLFYNVLFNQFRRFEGSRKSILDKLNDGTFVINDSSDSPFSYHIFLFSELEKAIVTETGNIQKYHFNFLRNILEKTSTFLGYKEWKDLLPEGPKKEYYNRIINLHSHAKYNGEDVAPMEETHKEDLREIVSILKTTYHFSEMSK